jgi:multimeric flavodoxin WrbA
MTSTKRVLIINGSPRPQGNTSWLSSLLDGILQNKGIETKIVAAKSLKSVNHGCVGCEGCKKTAEFLCVFKDEVQLLVASMASYDAVIFATPVYFFSPTVQIKFVLDRMYSLLKYGNNGEYIHPFRADTKFGLIVTAGGDKHEGCDLVIETFKRTVSLLGRKLEILSMPSAPHSPNEFDSITVDAWKRKTEKFGDNLLKLH